MIEVQNDSLVISFPEVHPQARLTISFQRTLRIPDDGRDYPLPPGLGCFPLRHVDDFAKAVPPDWLRHGGIMMPMYQSEALWLNFGCAYIRDQGTYPFAVKIATGKINAVTGESWRNGLNRRPQDYMVAPNQPWLDGFCVSQGLIRQFVAMPLGAGYSAEEQVTGRAEHGGLQIAIYPMKREIFEKRFPKPEVSKLRRRSLDADDCLCCSVAPGAMGLAPGGRMRQEITTDPFDLNDWSPAYQSRCFVHLCNSLTWRQITGQNPPHPPLTAKEYTQAHLPWFEYYDAEARALNGSQVLAGLKSVAEMAKTKGDMPLPENETVTPERIVQLRAHLKPSQVREGSF